MHLDIIVRDGQRKIAHVEVQTFEGDLYVAQLAINKGAGETRVAVPLDSAEVDGLIAALQAARKNIRKVGS